MAYHNTRARLPLLFLKKKTKKLFKISAPRIARKKNILKNKLFGNKVMPVLIKDYFCDIDTIEDFKKAQNFLKMNKKDALKHYY